MHLDRNAKSVKKLLSDDELKQIIESAHIRVNEQRILQPNIREFRPVRSSDFGIGDTPSFLPRGSDIFFSSALSRGSRALSFGLESLGVENPSNSMALELEVFKKEFSETITTVFENNMNKHDGLSGLWYPSDFQKALKEAGQPDMPKSYLTGYLNEEFFEKTGRFCFKLRSGKKASEALESLLVGPSIVDCGNATTIGYYKCVLGIIGEEKFNKIFSSRLDNVLAITQGGITDSSNPISIFSNFNEGSRSGESGVSGRRPVSLGEECHFKGVPWYANKHPEGFAGGWNVIYVGDNEEGKQLFNAHGFPNPLTEIEIKKMLLELYNRERSDEEENSQLTLSNPRLYDKKLNQYLRNHYSISEEEFEMDQDNFMGGFLVSSGRGLNAEALFKMKSAQDSDLCLAELYMDKARSYMRLR